MNLFEIDKVLLETKYEKIEKSKKQNLMHYHNAYEVKFLIKSDNSLCINGSWYRLDSHSLLFIAPYTTHTIIYNDNTEYQRIVLNFEKNIVDDIFELCNCRDALKVFSMDSTQSNVNIVNLDFQGFKKVNALFAELCIKYSAYTKNKSNLNLTNLKLAISSCLLELYALSKSNSEAVSAIEITQNETVREIINYLDRNYRADISLETLVKNFYVSKYYICRIFKKITGASIIEYLQCRRIIEAQRLLVDSETSITDICYECGFNNIQHFYRVFKKNTGTSPQIWRKKTLMS